MELNVEKYPAVVAYDVIFEPEYKELRAFKKPVTVSDPPTSTEVNVLSCERSLYV
jgi:hypothetical protein